MRIAYAWIRRYLKYVLLLSALIPVAANAAAPAWQIVPDASSITFSAIQNNAPVSGKFKTFTGEIHFDPEQLAESSVRIVVDMGSVTTAYQEVAETLKTPDWFNIKLFPEAIFKAEHFTKTGSNTYQADGTLTIRDKAVPLILKFTLEEYSKDKARAQGSTTIKRSQFGIGQGEWANTEQIKDDVQVNFLLTAAAKKT